MPWSGVFYNGLWMFGFDMLATAQIPAASNIWDQYNGGSYGLSVSPTYARYAGKGLNTSINGYLGRTFGVTLTSVIVGFAFETPSLPSAGIQSMVNFTSGSATVACIGYNTLGQLGFYSAGGVAVGTPSSLIGSLSSPNVVVPGSYAFYEFGLTPTTLTLYLNGISVLTASGSFGSVNRVYIGAQGSQNVSHIFDDVYLLDLTGAAPFNTYLGPVRIQTDAPNADSATGGLNAWSFTTPQGSDFANAANIPPIAADYNFDSNVGDRMSFRFPALSTSKVLALNTWYSSEVDAAGVRTIVPIFRSNNVDQIGPLATNLTSSYVYYNQISTIDPNTAASWYSGSVAAAQACEIGLKVAS